MQTGLSPEKLWVPNDEGIRQGLIEQSYVSLPFEVGRVACEEIFADFRDFVDFCFNDKKGRLVKSLNYTVIDNGTGAYYLEDRVPGQVNPNEPERGPGTDRKRTFHYGPQTIARAELALGGALPIEMQSFLEKCDDFYQAIAKVLRIGASALGLEQVMFADKREDDVHHLRLLDYIASPSNILGETHLDRAWLSVAGIETKPGLVGIGCQNGYRTPISLEYLLDRLDKLKPIDYVDGEAKLFAGAGLNHAPDYLRTEVINQILPLAHGILNNQPGEDRQAAALFGNPNVHFLDYKRAPGPDETGFDKILERVAA